MNIIFERRVRYFRYLKDLIDLKITIFFKNINAFNKFIELLLSRLSILSLY